MQHVRVAGASRWRCGQGGEIDIWNQAVCHRVVQRVPEDDSRWERTSSKYDESLYYRRADDGCITVPMNYVDDIVIVGDYTEEVERMIKELLTKY